MKLLVSCSRRSASKTAFAFMDFLRATCLCVSCSCLGGDEIAIHSRYPFHLRRSLDQDLLEPVTKRWVTMGGQVCEKGGRGFDSSEHSITSKNSPCCSLQIDHEALTEVKTHIGIKWGREGKAWTFKRTIFWGGYSTSTSQLMQMMLYSMGE